MTPTPTPNVRKRGWLLMYNTRFAHYMIDGRSLCGRWMALTDVGLEDDKHESPDNCKACMKKRLKLISQGKLT